MLNCHFKPVESQVSGLFQHKNFVNLEAGMHTHVQNHIYTVCGLYFEGIKFHEIVWDSDLRGENFAEKL